MDLNILYKALIVAAALVVGLGSTYIFKMKQDNLIEEIAEDMIKEQTNVDLDMTPTTKEA
jgi:hypothetical protein